MGVESWVYDHLGRPAVTVVGEVAGSLDETVDWISRDDDVHHFGESGADHVPDAGTSERVLMLGGCDLQPVAQLLRGHIDAHFHRVGDTGAPIHDEHSDILRQSARGLSEAEYAVIDGFGFLDRASFRPGLLDTGFDVLVYSALMDMTQDRYRHRATGLVVPWNQLDVDATDPADWGIICEKFGHVGMTEDVLRRFAAAFERIGAITPAQFQDNITWMASTIPDGARMIVINGSEFPLEYPGEPRRHLRHREINQALDEVAATLPDVEVCDVRPFTGAAGDFRLDIRHYRRHVYVKMAEEIQRLCPVLAVETPPEERRGLRSLRYALGRRRSRRLRARSAAARRE